MSDLITRNRALANLNNPTLTAAETTTLDLLIRAVSQAIGRYCHREFALRNRDDLLDGDGSMHLALRDYPVIAVERVATGPEPVLTVTNTSAVNQRATVQVTANGLTLVRVASGTTTTDTSVTWNSYPTLTMAAAAVAALGNGWSATAASGHGSRASADLRPIQGALHAKDHDAELLLHTEELADYSVDQRHGYLIRGAGWACGFENYRVLCTTGYETIPEDVQEACACWVAALFFQTRRDSGLSQEALPAVVARTSVLAVQGMPPQAKALLAPHRRRQL